MIALDRLSEPATLRLARVAVGWSLFELGSQIGVQPPRLSEFERGRLVLAPEVVARIRAVLVAAGAPLTDDSNGAAA